MEYKEFAIKLAREAGKIMKINFTLGMKKEWKPDSSPVTKTDLEINQLVINEVKKNFPDHDIKAEEESSMTKKSKFLWVCDPVDGTIPFSHGIPVSTFSLALVYEGKPIIGVVFDPFMNRLFYAEKGKGALLNGTIIKVSETSSLFQTAMNIENFSKAKYDLFGLEKRFEDKQVKVMKFCSIIYPSVLVANGEFIATIFPHTTCHDIAAIKIIVEEAGGKVTDLFGYEQRYDQDIKGAIISNGKIHKMLVEEIGKILK